MPFEWLGEPQKEKEWEKLVGGIVISIICTHVVQ